MKKILVPIDFSVASSWGYYYAYEMASIIGAELVVMHMYLPHTDSSLKQDYTNISPEYTAKRKTEIIEHLKLATQQPIGAPQKDVQITYVVDYGERNEISHYAKLHQVDLVVMGTKGAGSTSKKILGSNTAKVIENNHCPVLAIPEGVSFSKKMKIAYATDLQSDDKAAIENLIAFVKASNSSLHFIHINKFKDSPNPTNPDYFKEWFKDQIDDSNITFTNWSAVQVEDGLEVFCRVNEIDLLAVLKHDRSTWEKVFGERSTTQALAARNNIALLAFHD